MLPSPQCPNSHSVEFSEDSEPNLKFYLSSYATTELLIKYSVSPECIRSRDSEILLELSLNVRCMLAILVEYLMCAV